MGTDEPRMTRDGYVARCRNPVCDAGQTTREHALRSREERERRALEREQWERRSLTMSRYHEQERERREQRALETRALAESEGYCLLCMVRSDGRRRVRHRTSDFHEVRG